MVKVEVAFTYGVSPTGRGICVSPKRNKPEMRMHKTRISDCNQKSNI